MGVYSLGGHSQTERRSTHATGPHDEENGFSARHSQYPSSCWDEGCSLGQDGAGAHKHTHTHAHITCTHAKSTHTHICIYVYKHVFAATRFINAGDRSLQAKVGGVEPPILVSKSSTKCGFMTMNRHRDRTEESSNKDPDRSKTWMQKGVRQQCAFTQTGTHTYKFKYTCTHMRTLIYWYKRKLTNTARHRYIRTHTHTHTHTHTQ